MPNKSPTIRDVATRAGVSITTVSKFVNGMQSFSSDVEERIRSAIEHIGYRANRRRRATPPAVTAKTKTIAIVAIDSAPQFLSTLKGINRVALREGYGLHIFDKGVRISTYEMKQLDILSHRVDGFLVSCRVPKEQLAPVAKLGKPMVFLGRGGAYPEFPSVGSDGYRGARLLGDLLIEQGHRRIAYAGVSSSPWNIERLAGLLDSLRSHDLTLMRFDADKVSAQESEKVGALILKQVTRPDAIVCYNDMLAIGVMRELIKHGINLPRDVSLVGFDNVAFSEYTVPALTTIDTQGERTGELAMQLLLRQIREDVGKDIGHTLLEPLLVVRESTMNRA